MDTVITVLFQGSHAHYAVAPQPDGCLKAYLLCNAFHYSSPPAYLLLHKEGAHWKCCRQPTELTEFIGGAWEKAKKEGPG